MHVLDILKKGYGYGGNKWVHDHAFLDLFSKMFHMHPGKRISPEEILEHEFLTSWYAQFDHGNENNSGSSEDIVVSTSRAADYTRRTNQ